ncbi:MULTISPECIES: helix-turn-helix domain-containing protein [unclassified Aureimonas]|uniref:helix-turn-helix domain-containing protein n=1 Tax=unclassified Aureimonas TaxID=2615206 RepID=UPI0006F3CDC0|nr:MULTISPECIES: LysR family transcriptional regulator [unclassified Aureimonas]KQT60744.1 hypothetical protein ASG54_25185 [Aureimonas sp. Leaf460]KQT68873.1 hypothetical protein ASG62_18705 [Aureimonas sp. Leaf427]
MTIELRHLRCALAAADHGSFRRAAGALGVRPSSVSRRIRDLEAMLDVKIFVRSSGGVQVTASGQGFRGGPGKPDQCLEWIAC